ncbi:MAG: LicD family protein [Prevotella sp.]|nr:LicD family protein [Prevotella sp.]
MKTVTLNELHALLLSIAKEFARICAAHGIPYYMLGGTMLGAVRHRGFIPWDDDMDFGVPRVYFDRLTGLLERELPSHLRVLTMDNSGTLIFPYIKIEDTRTIAEENWRADAAGEYGVNIDVFPLDPCGGRTGIWSKNRAIQTLLRIQTYRFVGAKSRPLIKRTAANVLKIVLHRMDKHAIINLIERCLCTTGDYVANRFGAWGAKEIMPSYIFNAAAMYAFEDTSFAGVKDFKTYLRCLYGDYMVLPPAAERRIHLRNIYLRERYEGVDSE